jgi:hypothetical protein
MTFRAFRDELPLISRIGVSTSYGIIEFGAAPFQNPNHFIRSSLRDKCANSLRSSSTIGSV